MMKPNPKDTKASWLCATENEKKGVVDILLMRSLLGFCGNMRIWENGW
jgi:hypothetical protein